MIETSSYFYVVIMSIGVVLWLIRDKSLRRSSPLRQKSPAVDIFQKGNPVNNDWQPLIQAYLIEYGTIRDEFLKRVEISSQVQVYAVLLISGTIPLVEYIDNVRLNNGDAYLLYLLAALVFCTLGWYQLDLDDKVADMDNYVLRVLKPNLQKALENNIQDRNMLENVLGWHYYWRADRYKSLAGRWLSLGVLGRSAIPVVGASVLLGSYIYYEHFVLGIPWTFIRIFLVGVVALGIVWIIVAGTLVRNKLIMATQDHQSLVTTLRDDHSINSFD